MMYLNQRRHMAALGIQKMFLPTPYDGASTEWVMVWGLWDTPIIYVHTTMLRVNVC